ncbi:MAG: translation initiation factor IF-5A [Candidatus Diapherotrites archaeon]|nr:translation initiation factor IF-5A [Candidatus Micrarchaeota archaeon]MBU1939985.1 translation initiation factor IF-5A [Candidatus Micrarchaeota archaeon]
MEKKFASAGHLKPGGYVLVDGAVCQVKSTEKSKPGKHGSAKVRVTAMGIFGEGKKTLLKPTDADVEVPIIRKGAGQVVAVMGDTMQIMDMDSYATYNLPKPKDIDGLASGVEVEYHQYGDKVKIVRKK